MANPHHHAVSSQRKWGGTADDYIAIHHWFDESKAHFGDFRHRALRHHTEGIFLMESIFGNTITLSTCGRCGKPEDEHPWRDDVDLLLPKECLEFKPKLIPTRWVGEQHVQEDLGFIPPASMWLEKIQPEPWMNRSRKLSRELEKEVA